MVEPVVACSMLEVCTAAPDMGCATSVHTPASPTITSDPYRPSETAEIEARLKGHLKTKDSITKVSGLTDNSQMPISTEESKHYTNNPEDIDIKSTDVVSSNLNREQMASNSTATIEEPKDKPVILESLVDRIIELHTTELLLEEIKAENELEARAKQIDLNCKNNKKVNQVTSDTIIEVTTETNIDISNNSEKGNMEECEEYDDSEDSPSASEVSRSTRWEALADIAAELPASLTIDPLTGQIYALAK